MKKIYNLLLTLTFLFSPVSVFACAGDNGITSIYPFLITIICFLIIGIIYFVNFKKLLNEKWDFSQYIVIVLAAIPGLYVGLVVSLFWSPLNIPPGVSDLPGIIGYLICSIFLVSVPMLVRKRWVYSWGFALYFSFIFFVLLLVAAGMNNTLCGGSSNF